MFANSAVCFYEISLIWLCDKNMREWLDFRKWYEICRVRSDVKQDFELCSANNRIGFLGQT